MTTVTTENYGHLALRTASLMSTTQMLTHGGLGLLTEVAELGVANVVLKDRDYVLKELGDIVWFCNYIYMARFGGTISLSFASPVEIDKPFSQETFAMLAAAGEVGTLIKAYVFYGKEMDNEYLTAQLYEVLTSVHNMAQGFGLTFVEILQANIDKLALRYPSKFNQQDALARQDETGAATPAYVSQDGAEQGPP